MDGFKSSLRIKHYCGYQKEDSPYRLISVFHNSRLDEYLLFTLEEWLSGTACNISPMPYDNSCGFMEYFTVESLCLPLLNSVLTNLLQAFIQNRPCQCKT